jgi:ubiquinone/menaquinone biosynthesis C-methylase UbiE
VSEVMKNYYAQRAATYEHIYAKPERQVDIQELRDFLEGSFFGKDVLEIACGTGYWTEFIAVYAKTVHVTDINLAMLDLARKKLHSHTNITFELADVFDQSLHFQKAFDSVFAGFLWSHVKRDEHALVLENMRRLTGKGTTFVLVDNNYVEGESSPIARTDLDGNTYQIRQQEDGSRVEIIKNFPTDSFLRKKFAPYVRDIRIQRSAYFWTLSGVFK